MLGGFADMSRLEPVPDCRYISHMMGVLQVTLSAVEPESVNRLGADCYVVLLESNRALVVLNTMSLKIVCKSV
jgi:hypothetical protein